MKKSLSIRLHSSICSKRMLITVSGGSLILIWYFLKNFILYNIYIEPISLFSIGDFYLNCIFESHARSGFDLFAPALAVMPAATLFCDDYNCGYIKNILVREKRVQYIQEVFICSTAAGGLAVALPCCLTSFFFMLIGQPNTKIDIVGGISSLLGETIFADIQFIGGGIVVVLILLVYAFLFGAVWSDIGLCISAFSPNRYITLAAPFAIYFSLHLILYRTHTFLQFSPANMLMANATFIPNIAFPIVYEMFLLLGSLYLFKSRINRRLRNV